MRMQFYHCLIVVILPYFATATDKATLCRTGTSTGMAIGCNGAGLLAPVIGTALLPATFGISAVAGVVASASIYGGCAVGNALLRKGKEYYRFYRYLVKLNYFD